ncbi:MAG: hypothetical protein IPO66_21075 [Rhodanobacteraceae bacterium]|nr:hypothetical protein [Rhodanobacteraceae bacterium]
MMRGWWLAFLVIWPAWVLANPPRPIARPSIAGIVTDPQLGELSGLASSHHQRDRYWAINDGGNGNHLLLLDGRGRVLKKLPVDGAENTDWEDLASFHWQDKNWLLIADTGDNAGEREHVVLWLLPEPEHLLDGAHAGPAQALRLRYPDAPHDVEAMTVDGQSGSVFLLTKRTVPPVLYRVPLSAAGKPKVVTAQRVGALDAIPQPTPSDIARDGQLSRFRSQTTGLALDCNHLGLLVLTYDAVYRYVRSPQQSWEAALPGQTPARSPLNLLPQAEAMALDRGCRNLFVGSEKAPVPLLRFRYRIVVDPIVAPQGAQ